MSTEPWVIVHRDAPDTEREAAELAEQQYPLRALAVLQYLVAVDGDYDTHGAEAMQMWLNSYAPARNALMRRGLVADRGQRAINERGRQVIVWEPTPAGRVAAVTGDLAPVPTRRRTTRSAAALQDMRQWALCLAEALGEVDPNNPVLADWQASGEAN